MRNPRVAYYTVALSRRAVGDDAWQRRGIVVTDDECHGRPVALTARLQRAS
jgi:hypothetical protein